MQALFLMKMKVDMKICDYFLIYIEKKNEKIYKYWYIINYFYIKFFPFFYFFDYFNKIYIIYSFIKNKYIYFFFN
jgi:hypothetical protein